MKGVIDTNVLVSGLFWKGPSNEVLDAWRQGKLQNITSMEIISEYIRVLHDFKIRMSDEMIQEIILLILKNSILVEPKELIRVARDSSDNKFLEAAIAGGAEYIISQDNDLLSIKQYKTVKIVSPAEFVKAIE